MLYMLSTIGTGEFLSDFVWQAEAAHRSAMCGILFDGMGTAAATAPLPTRSSSPQPEAPMTDGRHPAAHVAAAGASAAGPPTA